VTSKSAGTDQLAKESDTSPIAADVGAREFEVLKIVHETYHRLYWNSADSLSKLWGLYFTVVAALVGYVLSKGIAPTLAPPFMLGGIFLFLMAILTFAGWAWGLRRILTLLDTVSRELDSSLYERLEMARLFRDWRGLLVFILVSTVITGFMFLGGMLMLSGIR
jgi:hypothetical protein